MTTTAVQLIDQKRLLESNDHLLNNVANSTDGHISLEGDVFEEVHKGQEENHEKDESKSLSNHSSNKEYKCSAVHTLERDMPDFDYSHLITELRYKILNECQTNEGIYSQKDVEKCRRDDWYLSRFLLRQKLDVDQALDMLKRAMRFNHESLTNSIRREDFPAEFYLLGGLFSYETDRKGNRMIYIRVKVHRKIPEIQAILHAYIYSTIQQCDEEADGKGICLVLDCSGGGLANADMDTLLFLATTLTKYFPKGFSYLLVHELPWILKPFWYIAKNWVPEEHRQLIKFSDSKTIYEYIDKENLPDFMGGTCKREYRVPPENCTTLEQAAKLWGVEKHIIKRILLKFAEYLPKETIEKVNDLCDDVDSENDSDQENRPKSDSKQE